MSETVTEPSSSRSEAHVTLQPKSANRVSMSGTLSKPSPFKSPRHVGSGSGPKQVLHVPKHTGSIAASVDPVVWKRSMPSAHAPGTLSSCPQALPLMNLYLMYVPGRKEVGGSVGAGSAQGAEQQEHVPDAHRSIQVEVRFTGHHAPKLCEQRQQVVHGNQVILVEVALA